MTSFLPYPRVMTEMDTLKAALRGRSIARYGDGELRICFGGTAAAQRTHSIMLQKELRAILALPQKALVCIPNISTDLPPGKQVSWAHYANRKFTALYKQPLYGSAFITRPDSAPHIDCPEYWDLMRQLWAGREVTLVIGTNRSLDADMIAKDCKQLRIVHAPAENAYLKIAEIERDIGMPDGVVVMCLGPTATVLACRLVDKGVQALDLGHVGMFMKRNARKAATNE